MKRVIDIVSIVSAEMVSTHFAKCLILKAYIVGQ